MSGADQAIGSDSPPKYDDTSGSAVANDYSKETSERQIQQLQSLLEDYSLSNSEGYPILSLSLPDGTQWSKLIWTRTTLPKCLYRWNTPEEVLSYLISFDNHKLWVTSNIPIRPPTGTMKLYNKTKTRNFRDDGYDWKTRCPSKKAVREDRMKLKVLGQHLICATYSHSESNSLFHRRCYWFTQNPDIVLVHYLETEANSHNKIILKKSQENGFEVTLEGTAPADYALLAISDNNICKYLAKGHDGEKPHPLLCSLSRCVWREAFQNPEHCLGTLIKNLNEKLFANITREESPVITDTVPLRLLSQAVDLLRLQAFSSQYGGLGLLPKGVGCLPPNILLQAASLILSKNVVLPPPSIYLPQGVPLTTVPQSVIQNNPDQQQPLQSQHPPQESQQQIEGDVLHPITPPSLESIRCFLPASLESDTSSSITHRTDDINMEDFTRFAHNLRTMNPLKDLQQLKNDSLPPSLPNTGLSSEEHTNRQSNGSLSDTNVPVLSDINNLEQHAQSLLSPGQISDLMNMDFESVGDLCYPVVNDAISIDCNGNSSSVNYNELNSAEGINGVDMNTEAFLEQFFRDVSVAASSVPFNPDSLLQNPIIESSSKSSELQQTITNNNSGEDTYLMSISEQLDIDNDTLAQLLNNNCETEKEEDAPQSPLTCYIESLVPIEDSFSPHEDPNNEMAVDNTSEEHPVSVSNNNFSNGQHVPEETVTSTAIMTDNGNISQQWQSRSPNGADGICVVSNTTSNDTVPLVNSLITAHPTTLLGGTRSFVTELTHTTTCYRTSSPLPSPSSPSLASVSSLSTVGGESYFDQTDPPSVAELCEMLGESRVIQNSDFSHLSLSDSEQQELIKASLVIQNTMRRCNYNMREKDAALCIERNYRRYRELKRMRDDAARRIQLHYRLYRRRTQELNRATLFIQQMFRYQRRKHGSRIP